MTEILVHPLKGASFSVSPSSEPGKRILKLCDDILCDLDAKERMMEMGEWAARDVRENTSYVDVRLEGDSSVYRRCRWGYSGYVRNVSVFIVTSTVYVDREHYVGMVILYRKTSNRHTVGGIRGAFYSVKKNGGPGWEAVKNLLEYTEGLCAHRV